MSEQPSEPPSEQHPPAVPAATEPAQVTSAPPAPAPETAAPTATTAPPTTFAAPPAPVPASTGMTDAAPNPVAAPAPAPAPVPQPSPAAAPATPATTATPGTPNPAPSMPSAAPSGFPASVPVSNPPLQATAPPPQIPPYHAAPDVSSNNIPQQAQTPMGSSMPPTMPPMSMGQYTPAYSPSVSQMSVGSQMSYQLQSTPRSKQQQPHREIKRRTKTGCLTCRKRRIKCDEARPICRNCIKSKRDCLGYDPVFRQQSNPSGAPPASTAQPSLVVNPQNPRQSQDPQTPSYPSAPPGYVPASAQPFAPSVQSDSSAPSPKPATPNTQARSTAEPSAEASETMSAMASVQDTLDGTLSLPAGTPSTTTTPAMPSGQVEKIEKTEKVKIQDLFALRGIPPPPHYPIAPIPQVRLNTIQAVYHQYYAPAIDKFLETRWFREQGLSLLLTNAQLMAQYSALLDLFDDPKIKLEPPVMWRAESCEALVVWETMCIIRTARQMVLNGNPSPPNPDQELMTAANRFDVLEALITDDHLRENPLRDDLARALPVNEKSLDDQLRLRSLNFWNSIGHFLTLYDNEASSAVEIDETLARARDVLDEMENRDVIYSFAIGRHLGQRLTDYQQNKPPEGTSEDERDPYTKLYVAQRFIQQQSSNGTNQIVQRLCGMVCRLWELKGLLSRES
ncbi:hypothetical protein VTN49DRAFT_7429 [Thermomyces lanuginosus]|uniref:uncharacterized protein n=1 Tax=Thermomyces lanuginosus TaxID=5541 RepID=UPI003742F05E